MLSRYTLTCTINLDVHIRILAAVGLGDEISNFRKGNRKQPPQLLLCSIIDGVWGFIFIVYAAFLKAMQCHIFCVTIKSATGQFFHDACGIGSFRHLHLHVS